ncbi:OprO/OprP family phosphate-selective porin [Hyphobacterium marinum]|uniref:Porin n=1 Tax=Hyphobacterium marinum TaxID=3116574 RepID=A0ABU7LWX4_9PROT|nr:porin [Hyphobacterium sp. Y6023]MEE2565772.1 porin [Hyphobacterium sp. Y6023]
MFRLPTLSAPIFTALVMAAPAAADDFTMEPRGRIFLDFAQVDESFPGRNRDTSDMEVRTARLGVQGGWDEFRYVAEVDFAGNRLTLKDVNVSWSGDGFTIRAGHFKTPNSIEHLTSGRFTTFMERQQANDAFRYGRRLGVQVSRSGSNYSLAAGAFAGSVGSGATGFDMSDGTVLAARATFVPIRTETRILHLGAHVRAFNEGGDGNETLRVRARPGVHLADRYVDARPAANNSTLAGLEAAYIDRRFHALLEVGREDADEGGDFTSWSASAGWFITGEQRNYSVSSGAFGRTDVLDPVTEGGQGAFEIAARFDQLDAGPGGEQTTTTLGLNWYATDHARVMLNLVHAEADGAGARFGAGDFDGIQARLQFDW